jgi:UDP-N-acetylmuramyl pentapeptide synthase
MPGFWCMRSLLLPHLASVHRRWLEGVTFIGVTRSGGKTSIKVLATALFEFMKAADAKRKPIVIGTQSDYANNTTAIYRRTAEATSEVADFVVFVGPMSTHALSAKRQENSDRLHALASA